MVEISDLVNITTRISVGGAPRLPFGRGLLLTTNGALGAAGVTKVRLFSSAADVLTFFGAGEVADAAAVWFAADPAPQQLWIGRWTDMRAATVLTGRAPANLSGLQASNATFEINGETVRADTSSASDYAAVAALLQTAIQSITDYSGATFAFSNGRFVLTLPDGAEIAGGMLTNTASSSDTDIADALGMGPAGGHTYAQGAPTETVTEAVTAILAQINTGQPVAIMLSSDVPLSSGGMDTRESLSAYAETTELIYIMLDTAAQVLVANDTTSHAAVAYANNRGQTAAMFSNAGQLPDVALGALMSSQNLDNVQSILTPHGFVLPNVTATRIDMTAEREELERKRTNVYTLVGGQGSLLGGYTSRPGYWLDAVWWLSWMRNRMSTAVWNAIRRSRRFSRAMLYYELTEVMEAGVQNGGLQPGRKVNSQIAAEIVQITGNTQFDGILTAGYLVWVDPTPPEIDRENRIGRFRTWCTGSDAIHRIFGDLIFQN